MSAKAVTEFWERLESDKELQAKFVGHRKMTFAQIVEFAGAHGFHFTQDEMKAVADKATGDHDLSEKELEAVAGGAGISFQFSSLSLQRSISTLGLKGGISPVAW